MAPNTDTLYAIDISNKTAPTVINKLDLGAFPGGISVHGNYLYVGTSMGLKVVDISNPLSLAVVNSFGSGYGKIASDTTNQRLFVAKSSGFDAIDISNPISPTGLFMGIGGGAGGDICYWNNYIFQNGTGNTSVFSVDSISATYIGSFNATFTGQVNGITVKDSIFYVSTVNDFHVLKIGHGMPTAADSSHAFGFRTWPSPVNDVLFIELPVSDYPSTISLIDLSGKMLKVYDTEMQHSGIDMSPYAAGMYVLHVQQGTQIQYKLLVKE